jgi:putative peptidoglycan lipid II flippase
MSLKQETIKLSVITGITTFLGFLFHILLGRKFGIAYQLDCFFVVLTLFSFLGLLNSFLTSLFIPIFNDVKKDNFADSIVFADVVIKWAVLISSFVVFITLLFNYSIIKLLASGFNQTSLLLSVELNQIIAFSLIFFGIESVVSMVLNALYYYFVPAVIGLVRPILNIFAIFFLAPIFGIKGIAISYLASAFIIAFILLVYLYFKTGWKPTLCFYHKKLPELLKKSSKMTFATLVWSFKDIITRNIASRLGEGSVALFAYAEKIIMILIKVAIEPLARVFYSKVSELSSSSKWSDIRSLFMRVTRANLLLSLLISSGLIVFLPSALGLLFGGSRFTINDIRTISILINIMVILFVSESFDVYLSRIIFTMKRTGAALIITMTGITSLIISALLFTVEYGIYGLAMAVSTTYIIVFLVCYLFTKDILRIGFFSVIRIFFDNFIPAFVFGVLGILVGRFITSGKVMIFIIFPIWLFVYLLFIKLFMKGEVKIK